MNPAGDPSGPASATRGARLDRLVRRAGWVLLWERAWPPLVWAGTVLALFLAVSWAGLWFELPPFARYVVLGGFAAGLLAALAPLALIRWPGRDEALGRLDRDAPLAHRPASGLEDKLANDAADAETRALWELHRARLAEQVATLSTAPPSPRMAWRDPRALRYAAVLLALAAGLLAGPERYPRILAAFDGRGGGSGSSPPRIDAWIDPPDYTNKPPLLLKVAGQQASETVVAPEDSVLVMRAEAKEIDARVEGGIAPAAAPAGPGDKSGDKSVDKSGSSAARAPFERRFVIHGDGRFTVLRNGSPLATFEIHATALGKPTISLIDPPQANVAGSLTLHYSISDAYGLAGAEAGFVLPESSSGSPKHQLVEPPKFALSLPNAPGGAGEARTTSDLSEHPWAGADVVMTLRATDVAGRVGESAPIALKLPQRNFLNPLAKALVEQRRGLILDPDANRSRLAKVVDALRLAPDIFGTSAGVYLGLGDVKSRLEEARNDKDLIAVADLLWAMALQIEDGDASQALRDLRAAEQKLREALQHGASDEEIRRLTKELREQADRYMSELAQREKNSNPDEQPLNSQDLDSLLDRMEDTARNGARDDAEAMLDQLQDMFENMRSAREAEDSPEERELRKQMSELDKLLRDQQTLRDDTFRRDQRERARRARPEASPDDGQDSDSGDSKSLQDRQQALQDRLEEMKRRLKDLGMKGEKGFDDADGAMDEAERDLKGEGGGPEGEGTSPGKGSRSAKGDAVEAQGRALQALREGAQGMQKQMQGSGHGKGGYRAVGRGQGQRPGTDPLGRGSNNQRGASEGALNEGPEAAARARRVLQELRRRLADPNRPGEERDYLERLLKPD